MQVSGKRLAFERHFDAGHRPVHHRRELVVAGDHAVVIGDRFFVVLENRPARSGIKQRSNEIAFTSRDRSSLVFKPLRLDLAAMPCCGELAMHVGEFTHAHADSAEVADRVNAGRIHGVVQARLIPFHADGLDRCVDQPALVLPALYFLLCLRPHHAVSSASLPHLRLIEQELRQPPPYLNLTLPPSLQQILRIALTVLQSPLGGGGGAGVRPWRRMISAIFARSGGPPTAALMTSAELTEIRRTYRRRRDYAESLGFLDPLVIKPVNGAARNT